MGHETSGNSVPEEVPVRSVQFSDLRLPRLDPMAGAVKKIVERASLIDGAIEQVEITVLPPLVPRLVSTARVYTNTHGK